MEIWTLIGLLSVGFVFYIFTKELGRTLPILELMLLVAGLQWIVGPYIEYLNPSFHYKYYMYVDENEYMGFVVPAYIVFGSIILNNLKRSEKLNLPLDYLSKYSSIGIYFVVFGFFADFALGSLGFFGFLLANFKYVGALILYYSPDKTLRKVFYVIIILLLFRALSNAMFHDFILWSVFFFMFWAFRYKPTFKSKLLIFVVAIFLATSLQSVKNAYRSKVWQGYTGSKIELFAVLMYDNLMGNNSELIKDTKNVNNNVRLNQGWIISAVMKQIPESTPFFDGSTIVNAIQSSLVPRVLDPNKSEAGGRENFKKFTGLDINQNTSMGISIIGEAYGNFGFFGGIIFMAVWAWFVMKIWYFLLLKSRSYILILAFFPLIFLQVVKAETELVVVLNHLIKTTLLVYLFFWISKEFFNWNLRTSFKKTAD